MSRARGDGPGAPTRQVTFPLMASPSSPSGGMAPSPRWPPRWGRCASRGVIDRTPPGASCLVRQGAHPCWAALAHAGAQFAQARGGGARPLEGPNKNQNDGRPVGHQWPAAPRRSGSGGSCRATPRLRRVAWSARRRGTPNAAAARPRAPRRPVRAPGRRRLAAGRERAGHAVVQGARELVLLELVDARPVAQARAGARTSLSAHQSARPTAPAGGTRPTRGPLPLTPGSPTQTVERRASSPPFWRSSVGRRRPAGRSTRRPRPSLNQMQSRPGRGGRSAFTIYAQDAGQRLRAARTTPAAGLSATPQAPRRASGSASSWIAPSPFETVPYANPSAPAAAAAAAPPSAEADRREGRARRREEGRRDGPRQRGKTGEPGATRTARPRAGPARSAAVRDVVDDGRAAAPASSSYRRACWESHGLPRVPPLLCSCVGRQRTGAAVGPIDSSGPQLPLPPQPHA